MIDNESRNNQIVRVIDDWISTTYIMILWSSRCSAITRPKEGLMILFLKTSKKGLLKRQRQIRSFCLDYHSTDYIGSNSFTFLSRKKATAYIAKEMK